VITAHNAQRDKINELGRDLFAAENKNQDTASFIPLTGEEYLIVRGSMGGRPKKTVLDPVRKTNVISPTSAENSMGTTSCIF